MFDIGWTELLVMGVVALIVIGPKDLPVVFQQLGRFTGKLRRMAREFRAAMDDAARETGVKEAADDLKRVTSPKALGLDAVKDAADRFEKWDPMKPASAKGAGIKPDPDAPVPEKSAPEKTLPEKTLPEKSSADASGAEAAPRSLGPETQALADRQVARRAILDETGEKLRALNGSDTPAAPEATQEKAPEA